MSDLLHYAETLKHWIEHGEVADHQARALEIATDLAASLRRCDDALRRIANYSFDVNQTAEQDLGSVKEIARTAYGG